MNLLLYGLLALAIIGALGGIGYKVRQAGYDAAKLECAQAMRELEEAAKAQRERELAQATKAAVKKERGDAKARIVYRTIREEVEKVVERPIYRDAPSCLDADGLRIATDAIASRTRPDPAKSDRVLRAPATPGRRDSQGSPAMDR